MMAMTTNSSMRVNPALKRGIALRLRPKVAMPRSSDWVKPFCSVRGMVRVVLKPLADKVHGDAERRADVEVNQDQVPVVFFGFAAQEEPRERLYYVGKDDGVQQQVAPQDGCRYAVGEDKNFRPAEDREHHHPERPQHKYQCGEEPFVFRNHIKRVANNPTF